MVQLVVSTGMVLDGLRQFLDQVDKDVYARPLDIFSGASIGQHTRHIIEFYQCMLEQYQSGTVNYDLRKRDITIEYSPQQALDAIIAIENGLVNLDEDTSFTLQTNYSQEGLYTEVATSIKRELVANLEHTIHHLALIKVGLKHLGIDMPLAPDFGIAPSTIRHRNNPCAQ